MSVTILPVSACLQLEPTQALLIIIFSIQMQENGQSLKSIGASSIQNSSLMDDNLYVQRSAQVCHI